MHTDAVPVGAVDASVGTVVAAGAVAVMVLPVETAVAVGTSVAVEAVAVGAVALRTAMAVGTAVPVGFENGCGCGL